MKKPPGTPFRAPGGVLFQVFSVGLPFFRNAATAAVSAARSLQRRCRSSSAASRRSFFPVRMPPGCQDVWETYYIPLHWL